MKRKTSLSYSVFSISNLLILTFVSSLCILPIIHMVAISLSSKGPANANLVSFWPVDFTLLPYIEAFKNMVFINSIFMTVKRVVLGIIINMILVFLSAYPLSKESKDFPYRNAYAWVFVFTMLFSGGLIPSYIIINKLRLMDNIWALVLPSAVQVFYIVLLLNFFRQLPRELEEASVIDGASQFATLFRIYLPLSLPAIATLVLFSFVYHWNAWFDGLIYMSNDRYPLQTYIQTITGIIPVRSGKDAQRMLLISQRSLLFAQIFISIIPIMLVYPFLQKHFQAGLVLGSVKE